MKTQSSNPLFALWDRVKLSLNDPQWGRKPGADAGKTDGDKPAPSPPPAPPPPPPPSGGRNGGSGGPPDLDELMKKVNDRVGELFGSKKGGKRPSSGSGGGGPSFPSISP